MNNEGHDDNTRAAKKCSICGRTPIEHCCGRCYIREHNNSRDYSLKKYRNNLKRGIKQALDARVLSRQYKEMIEAAKGLVACYWGMKSGYTEKQLGRYKLKYEICM
jgi:hypothetical protein